MKWQFTKGLHEIGNGLYAWLQPDGSWGWSNAGLVVDSGETLLVDTLFDLKLTRDMLHAMRNAVPAANHIKQVVNTHANGDHYFGNQLVSDANIIVSKRCAEEMNTTVTPESRHNRVTSSCSVCRVIASSAPKGSSISNNCGLCAKHLAI